MLSLFFSLYFLGQVPNGSTPDEMNYIYDAYSILNTHKDIVGNFLPLSFNNVNSFSPVPVYTIVPFLSVFNLSLFAGRLPFAIAGCLSVLLIYLITQQLFKNKSISLAASFVIAVSPWHIQLSRIAYECSLALFFFLLGTFLFLKFRDNNKIFLSLPAFLLGFYSYHATKLFFLFYICLLIIFFFKNKLARKYQLLTFIFGILLIFLSFWYVGSTQNVTRQDVFIWNNVQAIANEVNLERQFSNAPFIFREIFSNKISLSLSAIRENYLFAFSPEFLFLKGEQGYSAYLYNIGGRGMMYIIELPLIIIGLLYLFRVKKDIRLFLLLSLLIAPLPSSFTLDQSYGARSIMMLPFLSILVGLGIYYFTILIKNKNKFFKLSLQLSLIIIYVLLIASYAYQYFFRYSIYGNKYWMSSQMDLVKYLAQEKNKYKNVIVMGDSGGLILYYGLFNKISPNIIQKAYAEKFPKKLFNITFIEKCPEGKNGSFDPPLLPKNTLLAATASCFEKSKQVPFKSITWRDVDIHIDYNIYKY